MHDQLNPGLCHCGCGRPTTVLDRNRAADGLRKGDSRRFISGHNSWRNVPEYREEDRGFDTPCWIWLLEIRRGGYGYRRINGINVVAHRRYYEAAFGPIPSGIHIHHRCGQRRCVNPAHLEAVDEHEHMRAHARADRAKLTVEQVRIIKREVTDEYGSGSALARRFGVHPKTVNDIKLGKTWSEV